MNINIKNIKGIKKVVGETRQYLPKRGCLGNGYLQISLDKSKMELTSKYQVGDPLENWTEYDDANIVHIHDAVYQMTMAEIRDKILKAVNRY